MRFEPSYFLSTGSGILDAERVVARTSREKTGASNVEFGTSFSG